jgi:hypothetical protein
VGQCKKFERVNTHTGGKYSKLVVYCRWASEEEKEACAVCGVERQDFVQKKLN